MQSQCNLLFTYIKYTKHVCSVWNKMADVFHKENDLEKNSPSYPRYKGGFFERNKHVSVSIIFSCFLFVMLFAMQKTKFFMDLIPRLRGEIALNSEYVITTTEHNYPIIIHNDDDISTQQLRFSGTLKSTFDDAAYHFCKPDDTILEVGAFFGYNTINIAHKLEGAGKIFAFEAHPQIYKYLSKSIMLNDLENIVSLQNIALAENPGKCTMIDYLDNSSVADLNQKNIRRITVDASTIDAESANKNITFLLIDVPGHAFKILKGAQQLLDNAQPTLRILMAVDVNSSAKHSNITEEINNLKQRGFRIYIVDDDCDTEEITSSKEIIDQKQVVLLVTKSEVRDDE